MATSHVSRGPGGRGGLPRIGRATGERSPLLRPRKPRGLPPGPPPEVFALQARHPPRGARESQRPSPSQLGARSQPFGPPAPTSSGRFPAGVFLALASFRRPCLVLHDVMPTVPRFPRERGALRRVRLGCGDPLQALAPSPPAHAGESDLQ